MVKAKKYLDPNGDRSGRNENVRKALELAHDEIKHAIEISFAEGKIVGINSKVGLVPPIRERFKEKLENLLDE